MTAWPKFLLVLIAFALWTELASIAFVYASGLYPVFPYPTFQWWEYLPYAGSVPTVRMWLGLSAILAALPAVPVASWWRRRRRLTTSPFGWVRPSQRGVTDNHGHARWKSMTEARRDFPGPHPVYGGVVVGEAYRVDRDWRARLFQFNPRRRWTWGKGGTAPLLIDPCTDGPTHSLLFAGSGGFKTTSAIATILTWRGASIVMDPSCEVGPMLAAALERQGKRVVMLSPTRPDGVTNWGINVLDWIDVDDPMAIQHVRTVVGWIWRESDSPKEMENRFFEDWGKDLAACLLASLLWDAPPGVPKTLETLREAIAIPETAMKQQLHAIANTSRCGMVRHIAGQLSDMAAPETFTGIHASCSRATSWLSNKAYAQLVSGDAMRTQDLRRGNITAFVQIPLQALMNNPAIARVLIGALMNSVYQADGRLRGRVLFLLDEAARLGKMSIIETARDAGRKYGITLQLLYQSVAQLEAQWGKEGKRAWYEGVSWRGYAALNDLDTAEEVSKWCGGRGVIAFSEGGNFGRSTPFAFVKGGNASSSLGRNTNLHEIAKPLIRPEELVQDPRTDEIFVVGRGKPMRAGRAIYFRRPELAAMVDQSRFLTS